MYEPAPCQVTPAACNQHFVLAGDPGAEAVDTPGRTTTGTCAAETAEGSIDTLTPDDERFPAWALTRWPSFNVERLVAPGPPAAAKLADLRAAQGR
jgi:hypothetical protein